MFKVQLYGRGLRMREVARSFLTLKDALDQAESSVSARSDLFGKVTNYSISTDCGTVLLEAEVCGGQRRFVHRNLKA